MPATLIPLALCSALYPALLTAVLIFISQDNPRRLLFVYLCGALLVSIASGFAVIAALNAGNAVGNSSSGTDIGPGIDLAAGLFLLFVLSVMIRQRGRLYERFMARREAKREAAAAEDAEDPWSKRVLSGGSAPLIFVVGVAFNLPGACYLVALKDIAAADEANGQIVLQVLLYNAIMFMAAEIPLLGFVFAPESTARRVQAFTDLLERNGARIAKFLLAVVGAFLVIRGLAGLL